MNVYTRKEAVTFLHTLGGEPMGMRFADQVRHHIGPGTFFFTKADGLIDTVNLSIILTKREFRHWERQQVREALCS